MCEERLLVLPGPFDHICGNLRVPTSKSLTNRALIAAAAHGGGQIIDPLDCDDTRFLAQALEAAGWPVEWRTESVSIGEFNPHSKRREVFLGNSGTGARLVLALLAATPGRFVVDGTARLRQRPMGPLLEALSRLGASFEASPGGLLPVRIDGRTLPGGPVEINPEVSSQFVTALSLVGPLFSFGLQMSVLGPLPSAPYLDLTTEVLRGFGTAFEVSDDRRRWSIAAGTSPGVRYVVEGDWSAAAFPCAAAAVTGGAVSIRSLNSRSRQGDRVVSDILERSGAKVRWKDSTVELVGPASETIHADLRDCPDTFPALAAVAACRLPGSVLSGLEHLVHKESSRLDVMVSNLESLGAELVVGSDRFEVIAPVRRLDDKIRSVTSADDHRIAMAMAVTALHAGPLRLDDPRCVTKSFPDFWREWGQLVGQGLEPIP